MTQTQASAPTAAAESPAECIVVRGARVHNLQNIDVDIPRDRLVVLTGPSGSGKSSLAFDTLYAEGQRQYIESLSTYARQFLDQLERPDVDLIEGLQPTICIDQRAGVQNPRSTVATVTEIYDYLRLLYARVGSAHCYRCGSPIRQQTPEQILEHVLSLPEGTKAMILAPLVRGRKGEHRDALAAIRKAGLLRARVDGVVYELDDVPELAKAKKHTIEAVVDRVVVRERLRSRVADSIQLAVKHGEGLVVVSHEPTGGANNGNRTDGARWHDSSYSTLYACPDCGLSYEELEPRTFSFNSPYGACPDCQGLGVREQFDADLVLMDGSLSLTGGAIVPWKNDSPTARRLHRRQLEGFVAAHGIRFNTPIEKLEPPVRRELLEGDGRDFPGVLRLLEEEYQAATKRAAREWLETFRDEITCSSCGGARLRPEARTVEIAGRTIHDAVRMTILEAAQFFSEWTVPASQQPVARPVIEQIAGRLRFLAKVGVGYLTLDRAADSLSGGELQRIRLASGIGSGLVGVCYVLDEPSIGLHQRDNGRLIAALRELNEQGNSVLVVEHDEAVMRAADHLIDLGPGAGSEGGRIVAEGTVDEVSRNAESLTGDYLAGRRAIPVPAERRKVTQKNSLTLLGATTNNLKDVTVRFPLGALVCVTGVSGSGKSSLLNETLARALARRLKMAAPKPGAHRGLRGANLIDRLVEIDQAPIGRTPRSNPATYTGVFDEIRKVFAGTREARLRGYKSSRFSFNAKGGRCEECQGHGTRKIEMNFLPDLYVTCPVCQGARFNRQTLEVRYREHSIADVLAMRVTEAVAFFENFPVVSRLLACLDQVGLGYLPLGQASTTLSGGEAQRIKLAAELGRAETGSTLYLLDEPTTGLHVDDVGRLLAALGRLVDRGNTVIVIEHHLDVIKAADWIIDLGPEGGEAGGQVIATGTPEEVAEQPGNATGAFLRPLLGRGV